MICAICSHGYILYMSRSQFPNLQKEGDFISGWSYDCMKACCLQDLGFCASDQGHRFILYMTWHTSKIGRRPWDVLWVGSLVFMKQEKHYIAAHSSTRVYLHLSSISYWSREYLKLILQYRIRYKYRMHNNSHVIWSQVVYLWEIRIISRKLRYQCLFPCAMRATENAWDKWELVPEPFKT